ncbi:uncharacterized protein LOC126829414 [Patella vulgata]|uniref:uncharacterized protein LOC126829414 n=1 Tax=Patella vulgata TaxID=6465 RepID=UPI00217FB196|nr:uncharacterized protein LOC126829414 [Patella vulgata]
MEEEVHEVDYCELPSIVWVNIMKHLSLGDRYNLSLTCHCLHGYFNHPSLWSVANIKLIGCSTNFYTSDVNTAMPSKTVKLIQTFGKFFQILHLQLRGHLGRLEKTTKELLQSITDNCRLQVLTLEVGLMTSNYHLHGNAPGYEEIECMLKLIEEAYRLKELNIISWPMFPALENYRCGNIFQVLLQNNKIKNLESLNLFWPTDCSWSEREPILPSREFTKQIISHFRNLKQLSLRSPMMSEQLLTELMSPGRTKLQVLQIFINYSLHEKQYEMPLISNEMWKRFKNANPGLVVECRVMSRIGCDALLEQFLKPEIPLKSLTIFKYGKCSKTLLGYISENYSKTFEGLICLCDVVNIDKAVLQLVKSCSKLNQLVMHAGIRLGTIISISQMPRVWAKFSFDDKNIKCVADVNANDE